MFRWLQSVFKPTPDPYSPLTHPARMWLALEVASIFAPLFQELWPESPGRFPRRLEWALQSLREHISGSDVRTRRIVLAYIQAVSSGGGAMRRGRADLFEFSAIVRCAVGTAKTGVDNSQQQLLEVLSYAQDIATRLKRPDLWEQVDSIAHRIAILSLDWDDATVVPAELMER